METFKKYWWVFLLVPVVIYFFYKYYQARQEVVDSAARARQAKAEKAILRQVDSENGQVISAISSI